MMASGQGDAPAAATNAAARAQQKAKSESQLDARQKPRHTKDQHGRPAQRPSSLPLCRRLITIAVLVLISAALIALFRASGWTGDQPLLSSTNLHHDADLTHSDNPWASHSLPPGEWPPNRYLLGVGKADITGPVVELNMMGYADFGQIGSGLRQRLYSRAFIVGSLTSPTDRFIYLVLDIQSGDTAIRYGILNGLRALGPRYAMYGHDSLAVTATHSHSGPGAWLNYLLSQIPSKGFDRQSYRAIVEGCILSIRRAHESLAPGELTLATTKILHAGINRSLYAYLANPPEERARYNVSTADDGSVDATMTLLRFRRASDARDIGVLTWFPTHGTSMQANNTLISGDNKGVAADMLEKKLAFVAGFSQANMGDVSPNTLGARCDDGSGHRCNFQDSTCPDGRCARCRARGPGGRLDDHGASSCLEIGRRQYQGALDLYRSLRGRPANVRGRAVRAFHEFHDMSTFSFALPNGSAASTCPAALGYSFGAGTWDEPGSFDLVQHLSTAANSSFFWRLLTWLLKQPGPRQKRCQLPKSILLDVGEVSLPYQWTPNVVDIQTLRVGQLVIVVSPGEATTMAGRRWKEAVAAESARVLADELDGQQPVVVLGAPSNSYTHYITTDEEYGVQRYEGASTLYGRHTLAAYINRSVASIPLLRARGAPARQRETAGGPKPPDNSNRSWSLITGVLFDRAPRGRRFGEVLRDAADGRRIPRGEKAKATFVGANPRNNLRLEETYAAVERLDEKGHWRRVRDDSDWALTFHWRRRSRLMGTSEVDVAWEVEESTEAGEYRLRYYGDAKSMSGRITGFEGTSGTFFVA